MFNRAIKYPFKYFSLPSSRSQHGYVYVDNKITNEKKKSYLLIKLRGTKRKLQMIKMKISR